MIDILCFGLGFCAGAGAFAWAFEVRRSARLARRVARSRGREIAKLHAKAARARRSKRRKPERQPRPHLSATAIIEAWNRRDSDTLDLDPCPAIVDGLACPGFAIPTPNGQRCGSCGLEWR